jgi:hypothetical protein
MARERIETRIEKGLPEAAGGVSAGVQPDTAPDIYFSADVETDGPIPGEFSMLSFALVYAGRFDGSRFQAAADYGTAFEAELRPISKQFQQEALDVNRLDRAALVERGQEPATAMAAAAQWVQEHAVGGTPIVVAYPLSFDWTWLYWYFVRFLGRSPFNHSRCFDLKTAIAVRGHRTVSASGHDQLPTALRTERRHTHRALEDAIEQADMLAKLFTWDGK